MNFNSVEKILDFAMIKEQEAHDFYLVLSKRMEKQYMKEIFLGFAKEEMGHKEKIKAIKEGKLMLKAEKEILDLQIGDYLEDSDPAAEDLDYQKALIIAMKAEKRAFRLYSDLAGAVQDPGLKETLYALAQEEAKHKLRFEVEYDDNIYQEN